MKYKKSMELHLQKEKKQHREKKKSVHMEGTFQSNTRGFGFVVVDGIESDLYIPQGMTGNAFYGDVVEVRLLPGYDPRLVEQYQAFHAENREKDEADPDGTKRKEEKEDSGQKAAAAHGRKIHPSRRTEAAVVRIVRHTVTTVVGTCRRDGRHAIVVPDNHHIPFDITVQPEQSLPAEDGQKVVLTIEDYGSAGQSASGRITEVLGSMDDPGVDVLSIVRAMDLPEAFPEDVRREAAALPDHVETRHFTKRGGFEDLRRTLTVTIDGEDTKDIDDAVSLTRTKDGLWELGVHIADVSRYVTEGSALDREALNRTTSIYLVDRVIPMLPTELSNGICSLNEGEDRLALSCIMDIDGQGSVVRYRITESKIHSDARLTYTGVHAVLTQGDTTEISDHLKRQGMKRGVRQKTEAIASMLVEMEKLSEILSRARAARGAIDFDTPEAKIILDENGRPVEIKQYESTEANLLIENFMLMANETVARHCCGLELPFVYRSHGEPDPDKIDDLARLLSNLGIRTEIGKKEEKGRRVKPGDIRNVMERIKGMPEEATLTRMTLRSMQQAKYTTECKGHFGLALRYYCHFTSPIRRYPDLQIHRIIRENIAGKGLSGKRTRHYEEILPEVCARSSAGERRADDAERQTEKLKKCEYMAGHTGESAIGVVSGLTTWGMYVELPNTVEGLVPMACLFDDYYVFDEKSYILRGERTHKTYSLGDPVRIKVAAVDTVARTIDFVPDTGDADGRQAQAARRTQEQSTDYGTGKGAAKAHRK